MSLVFTPDPMPNLAVVPGSVDEHPRPASRIDGIDGFGERAFRSV